MTDYKNKLFLISSKIIELDGTMAPELKQVYLTQLQIQMSQMNDLNAKNMYDGIREIFADEFNKKTELSEDNIFVQS